MTRIDPLRDPIRSKLTKLVALHEAAGSGAAKLARIMGYNYYKARAVYNLADSVTVQDLAEVAARFGVKPSYIFDGKA